MLITHFSFSFLGNDDHKSTYNLSELVSNLSPTPCQPNVHLWDATSIGALLGKLTAAEVMKESGQRRLLESIFVYGLAIVDEVRLASFPNKWGRGLPYIETSSLPLELPL